MIRTARAALARTRTAAVPGMIASILLAGPALATPAPATTHPAGPSHRSLPRTNPIRRIAAHGVAHTQSHPPTHTVTVTHSHFQTRIIPHSTTSLVASAARLAAPAPEIDDTGWHQSGIASWYGGSRWHGNMTSSGARYDQAELTAAHATLPLGSHVRVTTASGRSVVVLINDRPGTRRRIIDLSRAAAAELGMLDSGIATVTLSLM